MKRIITLVACVAAICGCARFGTVQKDLRYDPDTGKLVGEITTKAASYTLFSSRSSLANWKATQSEKSQGAEVGGLSQQGGTNAVAVLEKIAEIVKALPK